MVKKSTLLSLLLTASALTTQAIYTPVTLTGFNQDLIANGPGPASASVSIPFDNGSFAFVAQDFSGGSAAPTYFLPNGGTVNSLLTPGMTYQLAPYTGYNGLHLITNGSSGTLTFATPQSGIGRLYILGTSGNGTSNFTVTVNYVGGTTMSFPGQSFVDWYNGTADVAGIGRVKTTTNALEGTTANPRLYRVSLNVGANYNSLIESVTISKTSTTGYLGILAITADDAICTGTPNAGTITAAATVCPNTNFNITSTGLSTDPGITYQWQSAPSGTGSWTNIPNATTATCTVTGGINATTDFQLVSTCVNGGASATSNIVTVGLMLCYCSPTYSNGCTSWKITNVTSGSFSHTPPTPCTNTNYTATQSFSVIAGVATPMSATSMGYCGVGAAADFNVDGDFNDPDEILALPAYIANNPAVYNFSITIPTSVLSGTYRLRLWNRTANSGAGNPADSPCGAYAYGGFLDYTINVINSPCLPPGNLNVTNILPYTANLDWAASTSGPSGYNWKIVTQGGNPVTDPGVASGSTTGITASASGLTPTTQYQLYVQADCGGTGLSPWSSAYAFTTPCGGQPATAVAAGPAAPVCPSTTFNLTSTGASTGTGITYQWQQSAAGAGTWTDIPNATTTSYTVTGGISAATDYQLVTTCINGGASTPSNTVAVALGFCYCSPTYTSGCNFNTNQIRNVVQGSFNHTVPTGSTCSVSNYLTQTMTVEVGATVPMTVTTSGYVGAGVAADFSVDGDFNDANETLALTNYIASNPSTYAFDITIPPSVTPGNYRLRVWSRLANAGPGTPQDSPCGTYGYGNFVDYTLTVTPLLAIKLIDLTATNTGNSNRLDWSTSAEERGDIFGIERSIDGRNYTRLATIPAKGKASHYNFSDNEPVSGMNYYRLSMSDINGKISYSKTVTAIVKGKGAFVVEAFPNPVSDILTVKTYGSMGGNPSIAISDVTGKLIRTVKMGGIETKISMKDMPEGLYLIRYSDDNHSQVIQISKQ